MKGKLIRVQRKSSRPKEDKVTIIKSILRGSGVVVVDVPVWFKDQDHLDAGWDWDAHGCVHMPKPMNIQEWLERFGDDRSQEDGKGWHSIAICGYDDIKARFDFKNSWGWLWGEGGFGTIPYDYIQSFSRMGVVFVGTGWGDNSPRFYIRDDSVTTPIPNSIYFASMLRVKNKGPRKIIATIEWRAYSGTLRFEDIILDRDTTSSMHKTLTVEPGEKASMWIIKARYLE
jgi:hypothetical protein